MPGELTISIVRSGGFAGLKRQWDVSAPVDAAVEWMTLVDACPWQKIRPDITSRDRFVYAIDVRAARKRRHATVSEASLVGPWKELVERVREADVARQANDAVPGKAAH